MNRSELDKRMAACSREIRKSWFVIALCPLLVSGIAFGGALANWPAWPLVTALIISPFAMSVILTNVVGQASRHVGLVCPYCGVALGGYEKAVKKGKCPSCSKSLLDQDEAIKQGASQDQEASRPQGEVFSGGTVMLWVFGTVLVGLGSATFRPHLARGLIDAIPFLENKTVVWGLVATGFALLILALVRVSNALKQVRGQSALTGKQVK